MSSEEALDVIIVGGGLAGLTAALALTGDGWRVGLVTPAVKHKDTRTTALLWKSVEFFQDIGVWDEMEPLSHPLKTMRLIDGSDRLLRAPQTDFHANEIELEAFGYNFRNHELVDLLTQKLGESKLYRPYNGTVNSINAIDGKYELDLKSDDKSKSVVSCKYLVGADGRNSLVRETLMPEVDKWNYPQTALVVDFEHHKPTSFVSTEIHTSTGPFTIVPQSPTRAGLVWMETPGRAEELLSMPDDELARCIENRMQSFLGPLKLVSKPATFPISGMIAKQFGDGNAFLVGEAAHVFPPIGAQGFNLGVRDIMQLKQTLSTASTNQPLGQAYNRARKVDINTRSIGVDLLNRSLLGSFLPGQFARVFGMGILKSVPSLRKAAMRMGISPALELRD